MTVHGTEINETQTTLKRTAIRGAGIFGPRTEVVAKASLRNVSVSGPRSIPRGQRDQLGVSDTWFRPQRKRREVRLANRYRKTAWWAAVARISAARATT